MLEQDTTRKAQIDNNAMKQDVDNDRNKYKIEAICNNAIYARKLAGHLPGLYYLVS